MKVERIIQAVQKEDIRLVRFLYCDNGGIIRGKATHANKLASRIREGIGQTRAMQAFTGVETLAVVEDLGPVGEFRLIPDLETFAILPYVPHSATMLIDMTRIDGQAWEACPRTFLKRMSALLAEQGMRAKVAVEHEFYLVRQVSKGGIASYEPADQSLCYSSVGLDEQAVVIDDIVAALEAMGLELELFHTELGPAQLEFSWRHKDVLKAADNVLFAREAVRGVARQHDLYASFAPKPFLNQAGSGAHIHMSLWKKEEGERAEHNLFYDEQNTKHFSQSGLYFIGGILRHINGLVAITCGSPNSYRRLQPHFWSSAFGAYGFDNREVAVRIPSTFHGREEASTNIEFKPADHSGNPYLALGALIVAGLDGIKNRIEPGVAQTIDPGNYSDAEREALSIRRLPMNLDEALDALEQDDVLMEALGPLLARSYIAVKRNEAAFFKEKTAEEEALAHLYKY